MDKFIEELLEFLENSEDEMDIKKRLKEPVLTEEEMKRKLEAAGWFNV